MNDVTLSYHSVIKTFNSLFEMLSAGQAYGQYVTEPFNSLFEMRPLGSG